jgi:two-component system response regulator YesN
MYRLVIVDDEEVIRNGLVHVVDWEAVGFSVVDTFPNGNAALSYLRQNPVDVVVADIRMPRLSGLDLARVLMTEQPATLVVILSGYDQFRYAQEAIDLNVFSYLLKPVKENDIYEVFTRVREQLDARCEDSERPQRLEAVREREAEEWLTGATIGRIPSLVSAAFAGDGESGYGQSVPYRVTIIEPHQRGASASTSSDLLGVCAGLRRIIADSADHAAALPLILRQPARLAVLISSGDVATAKDFFELAMKEVTSYPEVMLSAALGAAVDYLDEVPRSFASAVETLSHRLYLGSDHLLTPEEVMTSAAEDPAEKQHVIGEHSDVVVRAGQLERVTDALVAGDRGKLDAAVEEVVETLRARRVTSPELVHATLHSLIMQARESLTTIVPGLATLLPSDAQLSRELFTCVTLDECRDQLGNLFGPALDWSTDGAVSTAGNTIAHATAFIQESYSQDIALEDVAVQVGVSAGYLSRLFRQVTGETFKAYLTHVRLQEAKRLLTQSSAKVYEIADSVGYNDQHYFSEVFRKNTGLSPLEYRNRAIASVP